jgi:5'-nucleotidase
LTGEFQNQDKGKDTDEWALNNNFASVVPVQYDLTDYELIKINQTVIPFALL